MRRYPANPSSQQRSSSNKRKPFIPLFPPGWNIRTSEVTVPITLPRRCTAKLSGSPPDGRTFFLSRPVINPRPILRAHAAIFMGSKTHLGLDHSRGRTVRTFRSSTSSGPSESSWRGGAGCNSTALLVQDGERAFRLTPCWPVNFGEGYRPEVSGEGRGTHSCEIQPKRASLRLGGQVGDSLRRAPLSSGVPPIKNQLW